MSLRSRSSLYPENGSMIFLQFFDKFLTDCAWSCHRRVCYSDNFNRKSWNILGERHVSVDRRMPSLMSTKFWGSIYSIGVTTPGEELRRGGECWVCFSRQSPKDEKIGSKMKSLSKKNCFLRSMIFQNAKLSKRKFNNCDFFSVRIPLKGGRRDYSLRASKRQIYHTVWHKI